MRCLGSRIASTVVTRWDETAGPRGGALGSQSYRRVLEAQEIKETGNEKDQHCGDVHD